MKKPLNFLKKAEHFRDSDDIILIPEPTTDTYVYDVQVDSYRHRAFNYFTDIIHNRLVDEFDKNMVYYRQLKSMHEGM